MQAMDSEFKKQNKQKRNNKGGIIMKFSKILTVVLLVSVLAISLIACSTSKNNKVEKQSIFKLRNSDFCAKILFEKS